MKIAKFLMQSVPVGSQDQVKSEKTSEIYARLVVDFVTWFKSTLFGKRSVWKECESSSVEIALVVSRQSFLPMMQSI